MPPRELYTALRALPVAHIKEACGSVQGGPMHLGFRLHTRVAVVLWCWCGKRHALRVERVKVKNGKLFWRCPTCGRVTHVLFFLPPATAGCRKCLRVSYPAARVSPNKRRPKTLSAWLRLEARRLKALARRHKAGLEAAPSAPG